MLKSQLIKLSNEARTLSLNALVEDDATFKSKVDFNPIALWISIFDP